MFGRRLLEGMLGTVASDGLPYILHPRAVLDCSHYFLNKAVSGKGDFAKGIHKPGDATSHEDTETNEELTARMFPVMFVSGERGGGGCIWGSPQARQFYIP